MTIAPEDSELSRADLRRAQVLDAAVLCFGRSGFHGASMADIASEAAMSVGQIYRYFANKEAIIGSIVARDMQEAAAVREQMRAREVTDPVSELLEIATYKMDQLNPIRAALSLEILAEAARNPQVAEIVRGAERTGRGWLRELLVRHGAQEEGLEARMDLVILMVEGWTMRLVKNPDVDRAAYVESLREMLTHLFSCAEAEACR